MKGIIRTGVIIVAVLSVFLGGCGSRVLPLTEEEEKLIVTYASGAVSKANQTQAKGLTYLPEAEEEPEEVTEPEEEVQEQETEQPPTEPGVPQTEPRPGKSENEIVAATLTEVLKLPGITAEYRGYQVQNNYVEGDYFALNANAGNTYLIVKIGLSNTSANPIECDLFEGISQCSLFLNGVEIAGAMSTVLLNDFMTYMDTIEPAAAVETVLIFEVPAETAADPAQLELEIEADGMVYRTALE